MTEHKNHSEEGYVTSRVDYDGHNGTLIDLGLGKSPIGGAPELRTALASRDPFLDLADYDPDPLHTRTRELIIAGLGLSGISREAVVLNGNGSYGAGDEVVRYLALNGAKKMFVTSYSFPNVAQWGLRHGVEYCPVIDPADPVNPIASMEQILNLTPNELAGNIVYLDYPNNPFGLASPQHLEALIPHVVNNGGHFILDLAFGEVLEDEYRTVQAQALKRGAVCLGSVTKTQGFARLRCGWSLLPDYLSHNGFTGSQRLVFGLSHEADFVCQQLFTPDSSGSCLAQTHAHRVAEYNRSTNKQLYEELDRLGLSVHLTLMETSIQVVSSNQPDFYQRLMHSGIKTESLQDYRNTLDGYPGYGNQAVRLLTPGPDQLEETVRRIQLAIS